MREADYGMSWCCAVGLTPGLWPPRPEVRPLHKASSHNLKEVHPQRLSPAASPGQKGGRTRPLAACSMAGSLGLPSPKWSSLKKQVWRVPLPPGSLPGRPLESFLSFYQAALCLPWGGAYLHDCWVLSIHSLGTVRDLVGRMAEWKLCQSRPIPQPGLAPSSLEPG